MDNKDDRYFIKSNYEYTAFCNSRFHGNQANMLACLQNTMVSAIAGSRNGMLPMYFVIVLDDDLIMYLNYQKEGFSTMLGTRVEWLAKQFTESVQKRITQLPQKCKKIQPFFYWVNTPTHSFFSKERNHLWMKFNLSLDSVIRQYDNMSYQDQGCLEPS